MSTQRPAKAAIRNAMSIDLEDWFCVHNLKGVIKRDAWDQCELRVSSYEGHIFCPGLGS
jgi:hypothetical protein